MKVEKKVISNLTKCYSIAPLYYKEETHFLVAAEKQDKCLLFDADGKQRDVIWEGPGGVMTMVQVPGSDGQFLATHKFYSPNDSQEAKLVVVTPVEKGNWEVKTLVDLPFVHRFDILERGGVRYLIACVLKSGHEHRDDWRFPGKVYAAVLPKDLSVFDAEHQLPLTVIKEGLLKNHGYYKVGAGEEARAIISCENGVFAFTPPATKTAAWEIRTLTTDPGSDALLLDIDGDGNDELIVLAPFHGDKVRFYKERDGKYELDYEFTESREFLHSIYGGMLAGRPCFVTGHRKGRRDLMAFTYDKEKGYQMEVLDADCGSANVFHFVKDGKDILISTNREIDEVAYYKITE